MALSEYCTDDEILQSLRACFDIDEQYDVDFRIVLNQIVDRELDLYLEFRGRKFSIDKLTGAVTELNEAVELEVEE